MVSALGIVIMVLIDTFYLGTWTLGETILVPPSLKRAASQSEHAETIPRKVPEGPNISLLGI